MKNAADLCWADYCLEDALPDAPSALAKLIQELAIPGQLHRNDKLTMYQGLFALPLWMAHSRICLRIA